MTYGIEDIGKIIAAMREDAEVKKIVGPDLEGLAPFYLPGHRQYVAAQLINKDNDAVFKEQKYPLIALFMDIPEQISNGMINYNFHIGFFHITQAEYLTEQRLATTFHPVLYPLYWKFLEYLRKVGKFSWTGDQGFPVHNKEDRFFWGIIYEEGTSRYIFNDRLDAIEITELKISKTIKLCTKKIIYGMRCN